MGNWLGMIRGGNLWPFPLGNWLGMTRGGNGPDEGENEKDSHPEKVDADLGKVDFDSKDLEEEERECLEAPPKQDVEGWSSIKYRIDNLATGKATIIYENGKQMQARFIEMKRHEALNCHFYTCYPNHSTILKPLLVTQREQDVNKEEDAWFIFYENYEDINWNHLDEDQLLSSARNLLQALEHIHDLNLVHKGMSKLSNYVWHNDEVKLINIQGRSRIDDEFNRFRNQDIIGLMKIFDDMLPQTRLPERTLFLQYLNDTSKMQTKSSYRKRMQKLIRYPYLQQSEKRVKYFFDLHLRISNYACEGAQEMMLNKDFREYDDWEKKERTGIVEETYASWKRKRRFKHTKMKDLNLDYEINKPWGLLAFLRNVYTHSLAKNGDFKIVDDYATEKHPKFLCRLHETFTLTDT